MGKTKIIFATAERMTGIHIIRYLEDCGLSVALSRSVSGIERLLFQCGADIVIIDESLLPAEYFGNGLNRLTRSGKELILMLNGRNGHIIEYCSISGIKGVVSKLGEPEELVKCIKSISRGERYYSPLLFGRIAPSAGLSTNEYHSELTPRELEIYKLLKNGFTSSEIAEQLFISKRTVDGHVQHIRSKLNLHGYVHIKTYLKYNSTRRQRHF
jgi:DNA-binding NarL/FixJ family response regulator